MVRRLIVKMLAYLGLDVVEANTLPQARLLAQEHEGDFALFLADFGLEGSATGVDFLRWVGEQWPGRPRVLLTGLGEGVLGEHITRGACDRVLGKPVDLNGLRRHLEELGLQDAS